MTQGAAPQTTATGEHLQGAPGAAGVEARVVTAFEERYGTGSFARLARWLEQPCVTFAQIAERFGVSRELVRQWHRRFRPGAPTGHERQRLCATYQQRRRLFADDLFRGFFRHARDRFGPRDIEPIRSRSGYRARLVRIDGRLIALRDLSSPGGSPAGARPATLRYRGAATFLYLRLGQDDFLFVPAAALASRGISAGEAASRLGRFRNSFAALAGERPPAPQATEEAGDTALAPAPPAGPVEPETAREPG